MQELIFVKEDPDPFRAIDQSRDTTHQNKQRKQLDPNMILPLVVNFRILVSDL